MSESPEKAPMELDGVEMLVTVTFSYTARSQHYPSTEPRAMAALDRENFLDDPDALLWAVQENFEDVQLSVCPAAESR